MVIRDSRTKQAFLFDVDGTLVDSVYQHVLAWKEVCNAYQIDIPTWRLHRSLGMCGTLFVHSLFQEIGKEVTDDAIMDFRMAYRESFKRLANTICLLPGANELLRLLTDREIPWAIVTSAYKESAGPRLALLDIPKSTPIITRDVAPFAKPDPDLFLAGADALGLDPKNCIVVGDSVWDLLAAKRAGCLAIGVLSGGYGKDELQAAGAYRIYQDPVDMLTHLYEVAGRNAIESMPKAQTTV
jgi:HAD superfamily hydrolase (TIGR01509 family)